MIALAATCVCAGVLLVVAGLEHAADIRSTAASLPGVARGLSSVARALAALEVLVGSGTLIALSLDVPGAPLLLALQATLYCAFLIHLTVRYSRFERADCGCGRLSSRIGHWSLARAATLAMAALVAAVLHVDVAGVTELSSGGAAAAVAWAGGSAFAITLYGAPAALDGLASQAQVRSVA